MTITPAAREALEPADVGPEALERRLVVDLDQDVEPIPPGEADRGRDRRLAGSQTPRSRSTSDSTASRGKSSSMPCGPAAGRQQAAPGLEAGDLIGRDVSLFPEDVRRGQGRVAAEVDLGVRREPSEVEAGRPSEPGGERRLRQVHLGRHVLHPSRVARLGQDADRRGIAGEATIGEGVNLGDALGHGDVLGGGHWGRVRRERPRARQSTGVSSSPSDPAPPGRCVASGAEAARAHESIGVRGRLPGSRTCRLPAEPLPYFARADRRLGAPNVGPDRGRVKSFAPDKLAAAREPRLGPAARSGLHKSRGVCGSGRPRRPPIARSCSATRGTPGSRWPPWPRASSCRPTASVACRTGAGAIAPDDADRHRGLPLEHAGRRRLGIITEDEATRRLGRTLAVLERLERVHGFFYDKIDPKTGGVLTTVAVRRQADPADPLLGR